MQMDLIFFLVLIIAGFFTVFFSSAFFLFRHYFARKSNFFSYVKDIGGFRDFDSHEFSLGKLAPDITPDVEPEELSVSGSRGTLLKADYFKGTGNCMVVLVPGYADSIKTLYAPAADYLKRGFYVVIVYPQGVGKSEGKYCALPNVDAKDLISWLEYLHKKFAGFYFVLHGFSFGAATVLQSISSRKFYKAGLTDIVAAAVADSAFTSLAAVFSDYYRHFAHKSLFQRFFFMQLSHYMSFVCFLSGKGFFCSISPHKKLKKRRPHEKRFKKTSFPVFFIHGKKDTICNCKMATKIFEAAGGEKDGNKLEFYDECAHGGAFYNAPEKYMDAVFAFIESSKSRRRPSVGDSVQ